MKLQLANLATWRFAPLAAEPFECRRKLGLDAMPIGDRHLPPKAVTRRVVVGDHYKHPGVPGARSGSECEERAARSSRLKLPSASATPPRTGGAGVALQEHSGLLMEQRRHQVRVAELARFAQTPEAPQPLNRAEQ